MSITLDHPSEFSDELERGTGWFSINPDKLLEYLHEHPAVVKDIKIEDVPAAGQYRGRFGLGGTIHLGEKEILLLPSLFGEVLAGWVFPNPEKRNRRNVLKDLFVKVFYPNTSIFSKNEEDFFDDTANFFQRLLNKGVTLEQLMATNEYKKL